jgi:F-type H+-transporting ATPase subunit gamma
MANTTALKRRIGSVKNTRQITKAMELVAASKMKRAQDQAVSSRPYREAAQDILAKLGTVSDLGKHPLFEQRPVKNHLIVVITSDTGLAGAYDANVLKQLTKLLQADVAEKVSSKVLAIGKKGSQFVSRLEGVELVGAHPIFTGQPTGAQVRPIVQPVFDLYESEGVDKVTVVYTQFISSIRQEVTATQVLPVVLPADGPQLSELEVAIFEPSIASIVDSVVMRLLEAQMWQSLLESLASEHSMRMMAMKNASDNAKDIIDDLTLEFNTARQAAITQELAEIIGGAEALNG